MSVIERRLQAECVSEQPARTTRPAIAFFWWQQERATQQRNADVLAARRAKNAEKEQAADLPAAG